MDTMPDPTDATMAAQLPVARTFGGGRYAVRRVLGEGGQKVVHLVHDETLDRDCALSLINTETLEEEGLSRLRREAQAMARLGPHSNLVTIFDIGEEDGRPYLVCEYVPGGDLRSELRAVGGPIPIERALSLAMDIAGGLAAAHQHGVVHRDLKPANIWLGEDGRAKIGDFGLAIALGASRVTIAGMVAGTPAYLSPEQALGGEVDARSDLYSLGVVLYEMVTGRPPFLGDDMVTVISQHINTPPVAPSWHNPQVPRALEAIIMRLLAKAPEERPGDAAALRDEITRVASGAAPTEEAVAEQANPLDRLARGVFVGRERETADLRRGLEAAISGSGRLVMLAGEPGIGKTRLADELSTYAQLRGARVLVGRCYEGEGAPPYWPWVQILRSYVQERDDAGLRSEMGPGAADIAQLVPEVRERLPDLPSPPPLEPDQARFRLFDSITGFLKNASRGRPLVLVFDDLHWADKPSLLLLQFLAREMLQARLLAIGTYRDIEIDLQHPLTMTLAELARQPHFSRVHLRGLTREDVARFIEGTAGVAPPEALLATVHQETEGNPFFVSEIVRLLAGEGRLERLNEVRSWRVGVPEGVRDVLGRRLDHLSPECRALLAVASVAGREFDLRVLERASGLTADAVLEALGEAEAARLVEASAGAAGQYSFTHALIRETLYADLPTPRRQRLHIQIGEAIERRFAAGLENHLSELAQHFFAGIQRGDVDKAIEYATRAAVRASDQLAYEEAARLYEMALEELDYRDEPDDGQRCELLLALGDCRNKAAESDEARRVFLEASDIARKLGAAELLARSILGLEGVFREAGTVDEPLVALLEEALAMLAPEDSAIRARALGALARTTLYASRQRALKLAVEAVDMARRSGDRSALAFALFSRHSIMLGPESIEERLAVATEVIQISEELGDQWMTFQGHTWRITDLLEKGDIAGIAPDFESAAALGDTGQPMYSWYRIGFGATRALLEGRLAEAEGLILQSLAIGRRVQSQTALQVFSVQMFALRWEQGRLGELESAFKGFAAQYPAFLGYQCGIAFLYGETGRQTEAGRELDRLAAKDFTDVPPDINWFISLALLARASASTGNVREAAKLYKLLLPHSARNVIVGVSVVYFGSVSFYLGVLATVLSQWDDAARHFEDALETHQRVGSPPWVAHTRYEYGRMLFARDGSGDREKGSGLLKGALATAQELGMKALVGKIETLLSPQV